MQWETESNFGQLGTDMLVNGTMNAYLDVHDPPAYGCGC